MWFPTIHADDTRRSPSVSKIGVTAPRDHVSIDEQRTLSATETGKSMSTIMVRDNYVVSSRRRISTMQRREVSGTYHDSIRLQGHQQETHTPILQKRKKSMIGIMT